MDLRVDECVRLQPKDLFDLVLSKLNIDSSVPIIHNVSDIVDGSVKLTILFTKGIELVRLKSLKVHANWSFDYRTCLFRD